LDDHDELENVWKEGAVARFRIKYGNLHGATVENHV
jgi:hypothetical protein